MADRGEPVRPRRRRALVGAAVMALLAAAAAALLTGHPAALRGRLLKAVSPPRVTTAVPGGSSGASAPLVVVGLGDSVPSATTCGCTGYLEQLGVELGRATGRAAVVHNDAVDGWTSSDVERDLATRRTRRDLAQADLVVVEVGANDLDLGRVGDPACRPAATSGCWSATIDALRGTLTRAVAAIRGADGSRDLRIALVGYWNVTVDGAVGRGRGADFVAGSDDLTRLVNDTIADVARGAGAVYVDAYTPFKGRTGQRDPTGDLLDDGDHPDASGHALLADAAYQALAAAGAVAAWASP